MNTNEDVAAAKAAGDEYEQKRDHDAEEDEEMAEKEKDLADDAPWKRIQKNTFTRWCNEHLKCANKHIADLDFDFSDGIRLIALLQVLSQKKVPKHNPKPTFRSQKLENVSVAMKFMEDQNIKIVNIDSTDVVDGKRKLILGLIWLLILHYSISMPMWEDEGEFDEDAPRQRPPTAKEKLLGWIQNKVPELPIKNFTKDWNDGRAIGALVDACAPGLCPDWEDWDPKDNLKNAKEAMQLAKDWLDVPQLLEPKDMCNPKVDDLSVMTYLAEFPKCKLKPGAPLRPRSNAKKVRAYGPGLEKGNVISVPTNFTVETFSAGSGKVEVIIKDPKGKLVTNECKYNSDKNKTYTVTYTAKLPGTHTIEVTFKGQQIQKSPFTVEIGDMKGDASKCSAKGPGLEPTGLIVNQPTNFEIFTAGAGAGAPTVTVIDPNGDTTTSSVKVTEKSINVFYCEYLPTVVGSYTIEIKFAGQHIPKSPYKVKISFPFNPQRAFAYGRGIQSKGLRVREECVFYINTKEAGEAQLKVQIIGPGGIDEPCQVKDNGDGTFTCSYRPFKPGRYIINAMYGKKEINKAPFTVNIAPEATGPLALVRAFGPGLEGGVVGKPCKFTVETNGAVGALGFSIEGPSEAKIDCKDNGDGSCEVSYFPTVEGEYAIHITCDEEDIVHSPYIAQIIPDKGGFDASKVKAYGPGLAKDGLELNKRTEFTVDAKAPGCGKAPVGVLIHDQQGNPVKPDIKDNKNGTYTVSYTPTRPLKHNVAVTWGEVSIPESPFKINIGGGLSKVKVYGPGVEPNKVKSKQPTQFTVDCQEAGKAPVAVNVKSVPGVNGPREKEIPCKVQDNGNNTFTVNYAPEAPGDYNVGVKFGGKEVPQSPIPVRVIPNVDVSKIKVKDLEPIVFCDCPAEFQVDAKPVNQPLDKDLLKPDITAPSGQKVKPVIKDNKDNTYDVSYTPTEKGEHTVDVSFAGQPLGKSPYTVGALPGHDASRCKAYGPGLERAVTNKPAVFTVETKGAGKGGLGLAIEGPSEAAMECTDNKDGSCTVQYLPTVPGDYEVHITFADDPIPGSPFRPVVTDHIDASKVTASGPGLDRNGVRANVPTGFKVDATKAGGKAPLDVTIMPERAPIEKAKVVDNKDGTYDVSYVPKSEGKMQVDVTYGGRQIPQSPIHSKVLPQYDASKVKVKGPGVEKGVLASLPVEFTVDTRDAGDADLEITITDSSGKPITPEVTDNNDGTFKIIYTPKDVDSYTIKVKYGGEPVPKSPWTVSTKPTGDASKCDIIGVKSGNYDIPVRRRSVSSESTTTTRTTTTRTTTTRETITKTVVVEEETVIKVNSRDAGKGHVTCTIVGPDGQEVPDCHVVDNGDGTFDIIWTCPAPGTYNVDIKFGGVSLTGGPITISAAEGPPEDLIDAETVMPSECRPLELQLPVLGAGHGNINDENGQPNGEPIKEVIEKDQIKPKETEPASPSSAKGFFYRVTEPIRRLGDRFGDKGEKSKAANEDWDFVHDLPSGVEKVDENGTPVENGEPIVEEVVGKEEVKPVEAGINFGAFMDMPEGQEPQAAPVDEEITKDKVDDVESGPPSSPGSGLKDLLKKPFTWLGNQFGDKPEEESKVSPLGTPNDRSFSVEVPEDFDRTGELNGEVKRPSGKKDIPTITENKDGHITVKYAPQETGKHELTIKYGTSHVPGSPFEFHVDELKSGQATAYGTGLTHGICGEQAVFTVNTKDAGPGGLALAVEGPSKAEIKCVDNKDGTCQVTYFPQKVGQYEVTVKFADKHVPGSPFKANIVDKAGSMMSIGSASDVPLKITETDLSQLKASITPPSGVEEPCALKRLPNGNIGITFTPKEVGEHLVNVKKYNRPIAGSPFKIIVGSQEVGDASKVKVKGRGISEADAGQMAEFVVDTRDAGYGGLGVSIEGPSKTEINCSDLGDGTCAVTYRPAEPGNYKLNVRFAEQDVPGSPFNVKVYPEDGSALEPLIQETMVKPTNAAPVQHAGSECELGLKIPGTDPLDMTAQVSNPRGQTEDAEIVDCPDCRYIVRFVPSMDGVHTVSVKNRGIHVPGSPFQFTVGPFGEGGAHKVHAGGPGLEGGEIGVPAEFTVWTREAGPGKLGISVKGPAKAEINIQDNKDGSYQVSYVPTAPGEYVIDIMYNDKPIPDSPFKPMITPALGEARRLSVSALHESGLKPNQPVSFAVQLNGAKGDLKAKVVAPSGCENECTITEIDNENYAVRFLPSENGVHLIHVYFKGHPIPGSPFKVRVGGHDMIGDPGMVHAYGDGLEKGKTGEPAEFIVNTCGAGAGSLSITIDAPSKVKLDVQEIGEGYKCIYYPTQPGDHLISIKYAGPHHIGGSPFKAKITGKAKGPTSLKVEQANVTVETVVKTSQSSSLPIFSSDASKCTSTGVGLKKAFINKKSQFTVNCSEAGHNMLLVGIAGPKTPCEEIVVKHMGRQRFSITYLLKETGDYKLVIKWGDDHIPGSPFLLHCS
ncbi:filamin-C-like isoform X6 [Acanthaster planci]|uniref:Filamin-C-like isoform X6 n=1 Tax=Acanthaster planci TaxID=133434 RepID=A0A8B7Z8T4_ACAPL|nr:filamin-C-like isoform X6 [Acanthaster planci]